ncbi:MAG: RND family efflux transporter MFP subunit [Parcubacteria group bacterium GW2011_GWC1_41_7]|nr:MAG: RND family efflux transporter MFP subunit [Parcubacteria group bacterium GW2011_GWC1_41_7]
MNSVKKVQEVLKKIFLTKKRIIAGVVVLVILIGIGVRNSKAGNGTCSIAEYKKIIEVVSVSGKVKPVEDITLSFEKSGRIAYIPVRVGDTVTRGTVLASLEQSQLSSQLAQARANFEGQHIKLQGQRLIWIMNTRAHWMS